MLPRVLFRCLLVLPFSWLTLSCAKERGVPDTGSSEAPSPAQTDEDTPTHSIEKRPAQPVILGRRRENPFSLTNMQRAFDSLRQLSHDSIYCYLPREALDTVRLKATDLYVRIRGIDSSFQEMLLRDTNLTLFEFPLDHEILQHGDYYHDPNLKPDELRWYYTTIKPGRPLYDGIEMEVIEPLFLVENAPGFHGERETNMVGVAGKLGEALEALSFALTGNAGEVGPLPKSAPHTRSTTSRCYEKCILWICWRSCETYHRPEGYIRIRTPKGDEGLRGVKVRVWRWFAYTTMYTNRNGYFRSPAEFRKLWIGDDVAYRIMYDGAHRNRTWRFRVSLFGAVCLWRDSYGLGTHSPNGHSFTFTPGSEYWGRGLLQNAIYDYMDHASTDGITLPLTGIDIADDDTDDFTSSAPLLTMHLQRLGNSILLRLLSIAVYQYFGWAFPDLVLRYNNNEIDYQKITSIAWHELTHASHLAAMYRYNGYQAGTEHWGTVVLQEAKNYLSDSLQNPYGKKGDRNWQIIALSEGWAYYREWKMAKRHLKWNSIRSSYDLSTAYNVGFPHNYYVMYMRLSEIGISDRILEQGLGNSSVKGFKTLMKELVPSKANEIEKIVSAYE